MGENSANLVTLFSSRMSEPKEPRTTDNADNDQHLQLIDNSVDRFLKVQLYRG
jgi:hypothetical protein